MELLAGALLERPPGPKYSSELAFAELAPQNPLPKPGTLAKWRKGLPDGFELGLRAPESTWNPPDGPLRTGAALDEGVSWLSEASEALGASILVVATGPTVTTGARDRNRLRAYFDRLPRRDGLTIVWRPTGLWEPETVQSMARSLGISGGFDAVNDPVPEGGVVYGSLLAEGLRRSFSHAQLIDVLDKLRASDVDRAYVSVDSPQSFREARLLQALSEGRE
ncbi:MAG: hypothetical protein WBM48_02620 [Polyangiales bacterium]|jgi:uncharacterized protein YecE (DUF72 family)